MLNALSCCGRTAKRRRGGRGVTVWGEGGCTGWKLTSPAPPPPVATRQGLTFTKPYPSLVDRCRYIDFFLSHPPTYCKCMKIKMYLYFVKVVLVIHSFDGLGLGFGERAVTRREPVHGNSRDTERVVTRRERDSLRPRDSAAKTFLIILHGGSPLPGQVFFFWPVY